MSPLEAGTAIDPGISAPEGLWFDRDGRLRTQTDQPGNVMLCANPATGETRRFLTSPKNCEVTGVAGTSDGKTLFVGIQHPGEDWMNTFTDNSTWPDSGINGPATASDQAPAQVVFLDDASPRATTV